IFDHQLHDRNGSSKSYHSSLVNIWGFILYLDYALQDCMAEHQDWRKCKTQVQKFKGCMNTYQNTRKEQLLKQRTSATQSA
uniref:Uncharacterized protein n=2 Tax=Cyprinus carpio TaxID=7962 RepID=A0A8C1QDG3_CYPCA